MFLNALNVFTSRLLLDPREGSFGLCCLMGCADNHNALNTPKQRQGFFLMSLMSMI